MNFIHTLYDVWKKNRASKAQKKARKEAEQAVYESLLSSQALMLLYTQLTNLESVFVSHMKLHGAVNTSKLAANLGEHEEQEAPPPPPPGTRKEAAEAVEENPEAVKRAKHHSVLERYHKLIKK